MISSIVKCRNMEQLLDTLALPQTRLEVYNIVREELFRSITRTIMTRSHDGLTVYGLIELIIRQNYKYPRLIEKDDFLNIKDCFIELRLLKPIGASLREMLGILIGGSLWFPMSLSGDYKRLELINKCIEQCLRTYQWQEIQSTLECE